jgi:hypothetical protein
MENPTRTSKPTHYDWRNLHGLSSRHCRSCRGGRSRSHYCVKLAAASQSGPNQGRTIRSPSTNKPHISRCDQSLQNRGQVWAIWQSLNREWCFNKHKESSAYDRLLSQLRTSPYTSFSLSLQLLRDSITRNPSLPILSCSVFDLSVPRQ